MPKTFLEETAPAGDSACLRDEGIMQAGDGDQVVGVGPEQGKREGFDLVVHDRSPPFQGRCTDDVTGGGTDR